MHNYLLISSSGAHYFYKDITQFFIDTDNDSLFMYDSLDNTFSFSLSILNKVIAFDWELPWELPNE